MDNLKDDSSDIDENYEERAERELASQAGSALDLNRLDRVTLLCVCTAAGAARFECSEDRLSHDLVQGHSCHVQPTRLCVGSCHHDPIW